jgi:hypothetical protein
MPPFNVFLAPMVSVEPQALSDASARLKSYFDRIIQATKPQTFSTTVVKVSPHANEVGDRDLLAYITINSLIVSYYDNVYEPGVAHSLPGTPGGGTKLLPSGDVLSEVYWTGGIQALPPAKRGIALANLIFHEFGHNKHQTDATAAANGGPNFFVHSSCGLGIFMDAMTIGLASNLDINADNIRCMARVLSAANKQARWGLYSDELGF